MAFLDRGGYKLFYEVHGEGRPILFVHGWMMSSAVWRQQVPYFADANKVVVFDLTGYGQSDKPTIDYIPDVWLADVDTIITQLKLDKPVLVGWSMGASIGIVYAATRPGKISNLALVGATPMLVAPPDVFPYSTPPEQAQQLLGALQADYAGGTRSAIEMMIPEPDSEDLKNEIHAITQQTTSKIALDSVQAAGTADLRPLLGQINVPTTVLHGEADALCPLGAGRHVADNIPGASFHSFPGKGHLPFLTDAEAFNTKLAEFV